MLQLSQSKRPRRSYTGGVEILDRNRVEAGTRADPGAPVHPRLSSGIRVAYLLSRYPAISHTFFLHEVLGLRARGMHIETASINEPDRPLAALPEVEAAEARTTFYLKGGSKLSALGCLLTSCLTHPAVLWRGLRAVASLRNLALKQRLFWLFYLAEALLVGRWMRERRLTHLHVHFGGAVASVGMLASMAWRLPYSLTIHGPEELLDVQSYQLRRKIDAATFVICISDFCRSQLYPLTQPADWHKFHVVRLGVDPVELTPDPDPRDSQTLHLVCVGRLVAAKGHRILLEALRTLRERGVDFKVTLIGAGPESEALHAFAQRHGLDVTFTGALAHSDALDRVRQADVFVLASFAEGVPVALMEAMSLGVPCIGTSVAGIPELIRTGVDGVLIAPGNIPALAEALESLATDTALRRELGRSAREHIIRDYNLPLNHEQLARIFDVELRKLAEPPAARPSA